MFGYKLGNVREQEHYIKEDINMISMWVEKSAEYHDEDETDHARSELLEWCKQLMGDCCNLYEEIEKRFGIDVYND